MVLVIAYILKKKQIKHRVHQSVNLVTKTTRENNIIKFAVKMHGK